MLKGRLNIVMLLFAIVMTVVVGVLVSQEYIGVVQSYYDEHGEWPEPGGPPVMNNLFSIIVVLGVAVAIVLLLLRGDDKELKK